MSTSRSRSALASSATKGSSDAKTSLKLSKPTKLITLNLSPTSLARFATENALRKGASSRSKSSTSTTSSPNPNPPAVAEDSQVEAPSESNSTPVPGATPDPSAATAAEQAKRKGVPGPKPGQKRGLTSTSDANPKVRGKPGPKKKARLDDGTIDHSESGNQPKTNGAGAGAAAAAALPAGHKLGPKANQGAINAGLRALDRSGRACRKWEKKGFQIKSFTGVFWGMPTWRAPKSTTVETSSDASAGAGASPAADDDSKENKGSSAIESEKSNSGGDGDGTIVETIDASSPAVAVATPA
ncbi:MAG: hypothetical protein M4579_002890 [Chaenotheca gracillima]|nr:MAG: hypothetical protein M4579_002890 [Chaenotheca gracillima]